MPVAAMAVGMNLNSAGFAVADVVLGVGDNTWESAVAGDRQCMNPPNIVETENQNNRSLQQFPGNQQTVDTVVVAVVVDFEVVVGPDQSKQDCMKHYSGLATLVCRRNVHYSLLKVWIKGEEAGNVLVQNSVRSI